MLVGLVHVGEVVYVGGSVREAPPFPFPALTSLSPSPPLFLFPSLSLITSLTLLNFALSFSSVFLLLPLGLCYTALTDTVEYAG